MKNSRKTSLVRAISLALTTVLALSSANLFAQPAGNQNAVTNPFSPAAGHAYRHGVVPTREAHAKMKSWATTNSAAITTATGTQTLAFGGGVNGIGVTSGTPKVYLVVYGTQWGTAGTDAGGNMTLSGDTVGAVPYLQKLFKGLGTGGELWSGVMTQYCDGPLVASGATVCPAGAPHVGYPTGGAFAGIWYDNTSASPTSATGLQLAQEAIKAAAHFGNTTAASNRYAQYVILSPSGTTPDGFNTASGNFCAWHDWNGDYAGATSSYGDIAFTNMPYVYDAGTSCGMGSVNGSTAQGKLDGFSIVEGHEYAELITDQNPAGGWTNKTGSSYNGQENADECAWVTTGTGATQNVTMGNGTYAMQGTWSNDTNRCDITHPIVTGGTTTATALTNGVPVTGLSLAAGASQMFTLTVPSGMSNVTFNTSGGTGDMDLYVQLGSAPTTSSYLQKSAGSTTAENISITNPAAGTYYIMIYGYTATSGVSLVATYTSAPPPNTLTNGVPVTGIALTTGNSKVYTMVVPAGRPSLTFKTSGGTGDADIYVQLGTAPTTSSYLKKSDGSTTTETITITSPAAGTYYLMIKAYATFSGVSLVGTY